MKNIFPYFTALKELCRKLNSFLTFYVESREKLSRYLYSVLHHFKEEVKSLFNSVLGEAVGILDIFISHQWTKLRNFFLSSLICLCKWQFKTWFFFIALTKNFSPGAPYQNKVSVMKNHRKNLYLKFYEPVSTFHIIARSWP